jgi:hypothetical protein
MQEASSRTCEPSVDRRSPPIDTFVARWKLQDIKHLLSKDLVAVSIFYWTALEAGLLPDAEGGKDQV